jgi:hypothetical protein
MYVYYLPLALLSLKQTYFEFGTFGVFENGSAHDDVSVSGAASACAGGRARGATQHRRLRRAGGSARARRAAAACATLPRARAPSSAMRSLRTERPPPTRCATPTAPAHAQLVSGFVWLSFSSLAQL